MPEERPSPAPLPESLHRQLEEFRRRLWRTKIAEAAFAGIFGLLLSYLLVFGLDRLWPTPAVVRLVILLAGTSLMAVFAPVWLHRWVWKHRRENQLARLIARRHPGLGDRLLGVIELQEQSEQAETLSPRLRAAAMDAVAAEAARRKLDDSLPVSRHRRWSLAVILLFLLAGTALTLVPRAGLNALKRWLLPLSSTPRYTFTVLEGVPARLPVPQGEAFTLEVRLSPDSEQQPVSGTARYARQDPVSAALDEGHYRFEFPGQQEEGLVDLHIGDARHRIHVIPSLRPTVTRQFAEVDFPDYLQLPNQALDLSTGVVTAVQGSRVKLSIEASRALARARSGPVQAADPSIGPTDDTELPEAVDMAISGAVARTDFIAVEDHALQVPMVWTDDIGLDGAGGFSLRIDSLPDEKPVVYMHGVPSQKVILPEETIDIEVTAEDDFGIRAYGLEWSGQLSRPGEGEAAKGELQLDQGAPDLARGSTAAAFSPLAYGIGPQRLVLRAWAEDYLPGRERSYSQPIILYILSRDEHAQMLKNRFDRAISELEDMARRERNLYEENQRLERLDGDELHDGENLKRLSKQEEREREQIERMKDLAEKMEELLKDSTRNGTVDKETLRKMAETMQSLRELGEQGMPQVQGQLGEAQDQRNTEEKSEKNVDEAVERQKDVLEQMEETIEMANDANQRFEASTFVNRLKKAATEEDGVASAALEGSHNFGLLREQLDPSDLTLLDEMIRQQSRTTTDVRWIEEDLGHFFTRSNRAEFREVLDAMVEAEIDLGLEDVRLRLQENHGYKAASQAYGWAGKLREWAALLDDAQQQAGGGGGGGGGSSNDDEDFEFMLRVMKLVQQEQDLRARTRALETLRRSFETEPTP